MNIWRKEGVVACSCISNLVCTGQERDIERLCILHFFTSKYMSLPVKKIYCITRTWQKTDQKKRTDSYTELELFTHFTSFVSTSLRSRWPFLSNLEQVRCCLNMNHNCYKWEKLHLVHHKYIFHPQMIYGLTPKGIIPYYEYQLWNRIY